MKTWFHKRLLYVLNKNNNNSLSLFPTMWGRIYGLYIALEFDWNVCYTYSFMLIHDHLTISPEASLMPTQ